MMPTCHYCKTQLSDAAECHTCGAPLPLRERMEITEKYRGLFNPRESVNDIRITNARMAYKTLREPRRGSL